MSPWTVLIGLLISAAIVTGILMKQRQTALEFGTRDRKLFATGRGHAGLFLFPAGEEPRPARAFGAGRVHLFIDRGVGVTALLVPDGGRQASREVNELNVAVTRRGTIVNVGIVQDGVEHQLVMPRGRIRPGTLV